MTAGCNRDCFHCLFPDCIVDEMDAEERRAHREIEKDLFSDPYKKRIAAYQKAYYEANREEIAAYQKAYREANREEIAKLGLEIKRARRERGYTQQELANLVGCSRGLIAQYENGYARPNERLFRFLPKVVTG